MKNTNYIILIFICLFMFITWCSIWNQDTENISETEKEDVNKMKFYIDTISLTWTVNSATISKIWRIKTSEDIKVNSQASWKIKDIKLNEWDKTKKWRLVLTLSDTIWSYWINIDRARNTLEKAKINYDSTKISLDKAVEDSKIALDKTKKDLEIAKKDIEKQLDQAQKNVESSDLSDETSKARLDLEKLKKDLEKAKIDLENSKQSDIENIAQFVENWKVQYKTIVNFIDNTTYKVDSIIWYTDKNKHLNDSFERYLWNKDSTIKSKLDKKFLEVLELKDTLNSYNQSNLNIDDVKELLEHWTIGYTSMNDLLALMLDLLKNSSTSSSFTQETLNSYISTFESLRNSVQASLWTFTSFKTQVNLFLSTYLNSQQSKEKNIWILEQQIKIQEKALEDAEFSSINWLERINIQWEDRISNLEIAIKNAELNLETAKRNREITLQSLQNAIDSANISYKEAQREVWKLNIVSPIDWIINEIFIDESEEVTIWTPLFSIVSDNDQQIEIWVSADEVSNYIVWEKVKILYQNEQYTWTILSLSSIADENLKYNVLIWLDSPVNLIWDIVTVYKEVNISNIMLPMNSVSPVSRDSGNIYVYNNKTKDLERINVELWKIIWDKVEILSTLSWWIDIVLTDVSNFDSSRQEIILRN